MVIGQAPSIEIVKVRGVASAVLLFVFACVLKFLNAGNNSLDLLNLPNF